MPLFLGGDGTISGCTSLGDPLTIEIENTGGGVSTISGSATSNQTFILPDTGGTLSVGGGGGGVGTLQEVTNSGNTTSGEIVVDGLNIGGGPGTGANNTRVGDQALGANTDGSDNSAFGAQALDSNEGGIRNTAVGRNALGANDSGSSNTAVGRNALVTNTSGDNNTCIGQSAGTALTTGDNNTIIGSLAGADGMANTMLFGAGTNERFRVDENGNMMIGDADHQMTDAKLTIGNGNSVALGFARTGTGGGGQFDGAIELNTDGAFVFRNGSNSTTVTGLAERVSITDGGDVQIGGTLGTSPNITLASGGTATFSGNLTVGDYDTFGSRLKAANGIGIKADGTATREVFHVTDTTDSSTPVQFMADGSATFSGEISVDNVSIGRGASTNAANTRVGQDALANGSDTGTSNTAIGNSALNANAAGQNNTAVGSAAGLENEDGNRNTGVGASANRSVVDASDNTAVGNQALSNNVAGSQNTAVGCESQQNATTTTGAFNGANTSVGYRALRGSATPGDNTGTNNTAVGAFALIANTNGTGNTALGVSSLGANTSGEANVAVGRLALNVNTGGDSNTAVGQGALSRNETADSNIAIGRNAGNQIVSGTENTIIGSLGGTSDMTGTVLIGAGGTEKLRINGDGRVILPGTSPEGIQFGTTNASGNITSQTLDDYEEGTWSAQFNGVTTNQSGFYTKVGRLVTVSVFGGQLNVGFDVIAQIGGLPFTVSEFSAATTTNCTYTLNSGGNAFFREDTTNVIFMEENSATQPNTNVGTNRTCIMAGCYFTTA